MSFSDELNSAGSIASILGVGLATIAVTGFKLGQWWTRRTVDAAALQQAFRTACEIIEKVELEAVVAPGEQFQRGHTIAIQYQIASPSDIEVGVWLGASLWDEQGKMFNSIAEDKAVAIRKGSHPYERTLTVPINVAAGVYKLNVNIWWGVPRTNTTSYPLDGRRPLKQVRLD